MKGINKSIDRWLKNNARSEPLPTLGTREIKVLKLLWRDGELTAQQALSFFANDQISLSTMQSTLERLHRKNLVNRSKTGRFYTYKAAISQQAMISNLLQDIAEQISDGDLAPMISGFMSFMGEEASAHNIKEVEQLLTKNHKGTDDSSN